MIIDYRWHKCKVDGLQCVRGSKSECPKDKNGILEYCTNFINEHKTEDVER